MNRALCKLEFVSCLRYWKLVNHWKLEFCTTDAHFASLCTDVGVAPTQTPMRDDVTSPRVYPMQIFMFFQMKLNSILRKIPPSIKFNFYKILKLKYWADLLIFILKCGHIFRNIGDSKTRYSFKAN